MAKLPNRRSLAIQALDRAAQPVYVLDQQRRVVFINPRGLEWLQVSAEQVLGQVVNYHANPVDEAPAWAGLCPPPLAFAGEFSEGLIWTASREGAIQRYRAVFVPLQESEDTLAAVLVVVGPPNHADSSASPTFPSKDAVQLHQQLLAYTAESAETSRVSPLVGTSCAIQRVRSQFALAVEHADRVLLVGPPGSGRETLARSIHRAYARERSARLLPLDCALLTPELMQATVEAFARRRAELNENAIATLLLLEVDQLERDAQRDLATLLNQRQGRMNVLATAQSDIVDASAFRPDLAVRLATLTIRLPALIERLEDLPLLVQAFLERDNVGSDRQLAGLTPAAMDRLLNHAWRGNLNELADVLRAAREQCQATVVDVGDLPDLIRLSAEADRFPPLFKETIALDAYLQEIERELMLRALRSSQGNRAQAARLLGISRARFLRRLDLLKLEP